MGIILLLVLTVCVPASARAAVGSRADAPLQARSTLLRMSVTHPEARVSVIVQLAGSPSSVNWQVARLGGQVTGQLSLIHALVVTLPARAVPALAALPGVRWVSPDATVVKSS